MDNTEKRMTVSVIVARDKQGGIGKNGTLPWRMSDDLKAFKALTMGHHIIMGRKTYDSIARALPGRVSVVISRTSDFHAEGCQTVKSLEAAIDLARSAGDTECFVIGGGEIYALAMDVADRLYLTDIDADVHADTFFPYVDEKQWTETARRTIARNEVNEFDGVIRTLERVR